MSSPSADTARQTGERPSIRLTPQALLREWQQMGDKLARGRRRLAALTEDQLAIATTPKEEVWRDDMVRLFRYLPTTAARPTGIAVLLAYALVGRYQMIDLEAERSFVRKLLAEGIDVYLVDWGHPGRAQRWLTIDDYVSGYLDDCVDVVAAGRGPGTSTCSASARVGCSPPVTPHCFPRRSATWS
jgi:polyhydroxyalkanoate synthase